MRRGTSSRVIDAMVGLAARGRPLASPVHVPKRVWSGASTSQAVVRGIPKRIESGSSRCFSSSASRRRGIRTNATSSSSPDPDSFAFGTLGTPGCPGEGSAHQIAALVSWLAENGVSSQMHAPRRVFACHRRDGWAGGARSPFGVARARPQARVEWSEHEPGGGSWDSETNRVGVVAMFFLICFSTPRNPHQRDFIIFARPRLLRVRHTGHSRVPRRRLGTPNSRARELACGKRG